MNESHTTRLYMELAAGGPGPSAPVCAYLYPVQRTLSLFEENCTFITLKALTTKHVCSMRTLRRCKVLTAVLVKIKVF